MQEYRSLRKRIESTLLDYYAHISIMFSCCGGGKEDSVHDASSNKAKTAQPRGPPYGGGGNHDPFTSLHVIMFHSYIVIRISYMCISMLVISLAKKME